VGPSLGGMVKGLDTPICVDVVGNGDHGVVKGLDILGGNPLGPPFVYIACGAVAQKGILPFHTVRRFFEPIRMLAFGAKS
jgi:hypothetical protein